MAERLNLFIDRDSTTAEKNSSLRDANKAVSTRLQEANSQFFKSYQGVNAPDHESEARKNYRTYPYDYFSGTDAKVFFGDVWVDDIVTIQYTVNQSKVPIYGYASQLYDAVARGTVIVQGTLTVAFKEMGYLNMVQRVIETQRSGAKKALESKIRELSKKAKEKKLEFIPNLQGTPDRQGNVVGLAGVGFSPNGTAQIIRRGETIEDILRLKKGGNVVSSGLSAVYFQETNPNGNRDFEDFAEVLEDTIWGDSNGRPLGKKLQYRRADEFDYTYGSLGEDLGGVIIGRDEYANCLNILITFGDMNDFRAEHTLLALNDVHFVSQGVLIAPTGEPIGETYNFFARDINQTLTTSTIKVPKVKLEVGQDLEPSRLSDIQDLQKYLDFKEGGAGLDIWSVASFDPALGWVAKRTSITSVSFTQNSYEQLIDQLIRAAERGINDAAYSKLEVIYPQHIIELYITYDSGETSPDPIRMVIQQDIRNTFTYRVISPTRNNFEAVNLFSRDDMWQAITADKMKENVERIEAAKNAEAERRAKLEEQQRRQVEANQAADAAAEEARKLALAREEARAFADGNITRENFDAVFRETEIYYNSKKEEIISEQQLVLASLAAEEATLVAARGQAEYDEQFGRTTEYYEDQLTRIEDEQRKALENLVAQGENLGAVAATNDTGLLAGNEANSQFVRETPVYSVQPGQKIGSAPADATSVRIAPVEVALEQYGITLKSEGVNVNELTDYSINAAVVASNQFAKYNRGLVITSAFDSFEEHKKGTAHAEGNAIDIRTQHLGLTLQEKQAILYNIRKELERGSYRYTVLLENPGGETEHIHIEFEDWKDPKSRTAALGL